MTDSSTKVHDESPADVLRMLRDQRALFVKLESVASRQRRLITGDDAALLLKLLADRHKIAADLSTLGRRLDPIRTHWDRMRPRFSDPQRLEAQQLLAEIKSRMAGVIQQDEQDARLLYARKEAASRALQVSHARGAGLAAYRQPTRAVNRLDQMDGTT